MNWRPELYTASLKHLVMQVVSKPFATIAAGHAADCVVGQGAASPGSNGRMCLVAPTWRGPLPTMIGKRHPALAALAHAVDFPVLGTLLYLLNVDRTTIGIMGVTQRRHGRFACLAGT